MYHIGGLEPENSSQKIILGGTTYVFNNKFKTKLRDLFIDWGTFLEIYKDHMDQEILFNQVIKLLDIKETTHLRDSLLTVVKQIASLPAKAHLACMVKQFMLYEPISITIQYIFNDLKYHFEYIVKLFVIAINKKHGFSSTTTSDPQFLNWIELTKKWEKINDDYNLDSSSIILYMLNPARDVDQKTVLPLRKYGIKIKEFRYPGFCPYEPHKRLIRLLKFPLNDFVKTIKKLDPHIQLPNYEKIEKNISALLKRKTLKFPNKKITKKPPSSLLNESPETRLKLLKWYVNTILDFRKSLAKEGKKIEDYYIDLAKTLKKVHKEIEKLPAY